MRPLPSRRHLALPLISAVVAALALVLLPLSPATAAVTQGISGTVTGQSAGGLQYVWVSAYRDLGGADGIDWVSGTQTDASGHYEMSLGSGQYYLEFQPMAPYATEWWNNATTLGTGATVTVGAGVTSGVSPVLELAAHITGTIAQAIGTTGDVAVYAADPTGANGYTQVADSIVDGTTGQYDIGGLRAGSYKLGFNVHGFQPEYWQDKTGVATADAVPATAGATTGNINPTLAPYGQVQGTVTLPGGAPASGVDVRLYMHDIDGWHPNWDDDWEDITDANGHYTIPAPNGTYRVEFTSADPALQTEFWQNKHRVDDAQDVTISAPAVTANVNAELEVGGHVTGTVSQAVGIGGSVTAWVEQHPGTGDWYRVKSAQISKVDGSYHVDGLTTDHYKMHFSVKGFDGEWWQDQADLATATEIAVTAPDTFAAVSPTLTPHVHIAGTITGPSHSPVGDGYVSAFRFDGSRWVHSRNAGLRSDGTYDLDVSAGSYRLRVNGWTDPDWTTPYATEFYDNAKTLESATTIAATTPGQTYAGKDVQLDDAAALGGTLNFPSAAERGRRMDRVVSVYDKADGNLVTTTVARFSSSTDTTADWSVEDLAAGSYRVDFARISGPSLPDGSDGSYSASFDRLSGPALMEGQYYDGTPESGGAAGATSVTVNPGDSNYGVDATMHLGGVIHGSLVNGQGQGLAGCRIQATSTIGGKLVTRSNITSPDGSFDVTGLSSGDYNLTVLDRGGCDHAEYYTGADGDLSMTGSGPVAVHTTVGSTTTLPAQLLYGANLGALPITNTSPPTVPGGVPVVGTAVTASPGTWTPSGTTLAYQWLANGAPIGGATSVSYTPGAADVGMTLSVTVTASKSGYTAKAVTSNSTAAVTSAAAPPPSVFTVITVPKMLGTLKVGKVLKAVPPTVSPAATAVQFQWLRNGKVISGVAAKRVRYKLVRADRGRRVSVRITVLRPGYAPSVTVVKKAGKVR